MFKLDQHVRDVLGVLLELFKQTFHFAVVSGILLSVNPMLPERLGDHRTLMVADAMQESLGISSERAMADALT